MPASISHRAFIQWLPQKPSETTSTLVLTSHEGRFVDIRLVKPVVIGATVAADKLDWAFAGTSVSSPVDTDQHSLSSVSTRQYEQFVDDMDGMDEPLNDSMMHTTWTHTVDSHHVDVTGVSDEGDMLFVPELGMTLEAGRMVNPATGKATEYREGWIDVDIEPPTTCIVLELQSPKGTGMLVRLGQWVQGVSRCNGEINLQRWRLVEDDWIQHAGMGSTDFPIEAAVNEIAAVGTIFEVKDSQQQAWQWKVVESSTV